MFLKCPVQVVYYKLPYKSIKYNFLVLRTLSKRNSVACIAQQKRGSKRRNFIKNELVY